MKNVETKDEVHKEQFVVQGRHTDIEKDMLVHSFSDITQQSIPLLIAVAAIIGFLIWTQDASQA